MKERFKAILSVYGIFRRDDHVFLIRRQNTGYMDGYYGLPAGHVEEGESIRQAFVREIQEEVGVVPDWKACQLLHVRSRNADCHRADFFFQVTRWTGELSNCEPNKCDHVEWFPLASLPAETIPYIADTLRCLQNGVMYSEDGWNENLYSV